MCGIIGYYGKDGKAIDVILNGLKRMEYRGYDSAGVAFFDENILVVKNVGRIKDLESKLNGIERIFDIGIGHTRWATHGKVSEENAHPHTNMDETIAVVHNGIIENHAELRKQLKEKGYNFKTETDTEVIPHLIDFHYKKNNDGDFKKAFTDALKELIGAYAIVAIHKDENRIYCAKFGSSPLRLGVSKSKDEIIVASDRLALIGICEEEQILENGEIVVISKDYEKGYNIEDFEGFEIEDILRKVPKDIEAITKGEYEDFMLKEIREQPNTIRTAVGGRIEHLETLAIDNFPDLPREISRLILLACGTSWHAGKVAEYLFDEKTGIVCQAEIASEFRYKRPVLFPNDFVIAISQSGETADTLAALKLAKEKGCYIGGIVNSVGSSIAQTAAKGVYLHAGPEIGVASTKAFTSQVAVLTILKAFLTNDDNYIKKLKDGFSELPSKIEEVFKIEEQIKDIAERISGFERFLFLGRGINYPVALEGALKFKEITYRLAEGYPAGEMKHGPIALIDRETPSIFILSGKNEYYEKTMSNIQEVKSRDGRVIIVTDDKEALRKNGCLTKTDFIIEVPRIIEELSPIINVIPLQLLAYYSAKFLGWDVDKPRNLAKSVTVE